MKVIYSFLRQSRGLVTLAVVAAVLSGATSTAVITLIHALVSGDESATGAQALVFIGLCALVVLSQLVSEFVLLRLSEGSVFDLRLAMSRRILATPLRKLETLGSHRLLATVTDDVRNVSQAVTLSPLLCMYSAIIAACLAYMLWLDWRLFLGFIAVFGSTLFLYQAAAQRGERFIAVARNESDTLFKALQGLAVGTKELKLNTRRRTAFLRELLEEPATAVRRQNLSGHMTYRVAGLLGRIVFLVIFGLLLFVAPRLVEVDRATINGYILTLLYMNMPLTGLLNVLPTLGSARVALRKIEQLGLTLDQEAEKTEEQPLAGGEISWRSVELAGVTHTYRRESEDENFTLGPVDFALSPGEVVFLVGGNGSGKTTLAKLLVGLYTPESGEVRLNGRTVTERDLDLYRQHFSMVFTDFHLFDKLLGFDGPDMDERAREYVAKLHLDRKVEVRDGRLSTTDLSQGQRKRLALLNAYLEDRPIYVFDEWAADQDPVFKRVFYRQLLPELRARGKAVVVISHDDHYYDAADRIVKLDYGAMEPYQAADEEVQAVRLGGIA